MAGIRNIDESKIPIERYLGLRGDKMIGTTSFGYNTTTNFLWIAGHSLWAGWVVAIIIILIILGMIIGYLNRDKIIKARMAAIARAQAIKDAQAKPPTTQTA